VTLVLGYLVAGYLVGLAAADYGAERVARGAFPAIRRLRAVVTVVALAIGLCWPAVFVTALWWTLRDAVSVLVGRRGRP